MGQHCRAGRAVSFSGAGDVSHQQIDAGTGNHGFTQFRFPEVAAKIRGETVRLGPPACEVGAAEHARTEGFGTDREKHRTRLATVELL